MPRQSSIIPSAWWFKQTEHIIPNHVLSVPDANVTIGRKCTPFPIEFVVRGYITGSTSTSMWTNYANGRSFLSRSLRRCPPLLRH